MNIEDPVFGVVGPCAAGKTTLVADLRALGYTVRHIAQEHSHVPNMWKIISNPDYMIYLDVSFDISSARAGTSWTRSIFDKQVERLAHAREHADLYIQTNDKKPKQVLEIVLSEIGIL